MTKALCSAILVLMVASCKTTEVDRNSGASPAVSCNYSSQAECDKYRACKWDAGFCRASNLNSMACSDQRDMLACQNAHCVWSNNYCSDPTGGNTAFDCKTLSGEQKCRVESSRCSWDPVRSECVTPGAQVVDCNQYSATKTLCDIYPNQCEWSTSVTPPQCTPRSSVQPTQSCSDTLNQTKAACDKLTSQCRWDASTNRCVALSNVQPNPPSSTGCATMDQNTCLKDTTGCAWDYGINVCYTAAIVRCHLYTSQASCAQVANQCQWTNMGCSNIEPVPCDRLLWITQCLGFPVCAWDYFRFECYRR